MKTPSTVVLGKLRCAVKGGARRFRASDGTWYWQVTTRGRDRVQVDAFRDTVAGAEERLAALVADRAHEHVERRREQVAACTTVTDLLQLWGGEVKTRSDLAPGTVREYRERVRRLKPRIGRMHVARLTDADVEEYIHRAVREGYAERTARSDVTVLLMAWRWGRRRGWHDRPDLEPRLRPPKPKRPPYVPSDDEVRKTLAHLTGWRDPFIRLQWMTGARMGEIAYLEVADVDLARGGFWAGRHVRARKTGERWVQCAEDAQAILRRLVDGATGPRLWSGYGVAPESIRTNINTRYLKAACERAEVRKWTTHGLRHRAADRMAEARVDLVAAAAHLGQSVGTMNRTYRRVSASQASDAAAALSRSGEHLKAVEDEG